MPGSCGPIAGAALPGAPAEGPLAVGIGASAGGLDAVGRLLDALGRVQGMAFILIQHLDPTHESMMVDLLAHHTPMTVLQAQDGMPVADGHLYVIPPGMALSVSSGALRLSPPQARHGARLPFDFLLHAMADEYGARAVCIILSGSGADGSLGLRAIKARHGLVIAQDPLEAGYDGMPRSAIQTGAVDLVLPIAQMPEALMQYQARLDHGSAADGPGARDPPPSRFAAIIDLLRLETAYDFTLYKHGTLQRRIERRMAMAGFAPDDADGYLGRLRGDKTERDLLATDLLINVTSFFRDPQVFDVLAARIVPDLIARTAAEPSLRVWVAGCSTGEETYSLAMLFCEAIADAKLSLRLQIFASDVDPDAVAIAREGLYPEAIAAEVSAARLARFFTREDHAWRVTPELRASVVFALQDVLTDPPFARIDFVSCRNLLIYLRPEAQAKVIAVFGFALREGGILLLGSAETIGQAPDFEVVSKPERLYRRVGRGRRGEFAQATSARYGIRNLLRLEPLPRQSALAELCRRLVLDSYAPAAILINRRHECLYSLGPTDRYLRMAPGLASLDLLAMVRQGLRSKLRAAIEAATQDGALTRVAGGRIIHDGAPLWFSITVQPVKNDGEDLLLICFIEEPQREMLPQPAAGTAGAPRMAELERELELTRTELQSAIRGLETASEEQTAIHEEALSVNEEYQSTNEELLTSKEELQSLNEELTALNSQLQETLERQRTTANDLQNILYSTDIATIFLDADLDIRFFTPSTRAIFNIIPGDVGRPLADLAALATDASLLSDARAILRTLSPIEREIEGRSGAWYIRRVLPYRTHDNRVAGVVITFTDITERKHVASALQAAKQQSEQANLAKSRFLAAASHDLRQPLQTLALLQGLLARQVKGTAAEKLVALLDPTLSAMSGMLNTLLDINQIDAGTVEPQPVTFAIDDLLERLRDEFGYHAQAQGLVLRVVRCGLLVHSDPRLLEQMIRNLLSNALKYTRRGRVLLGCRRGREMLSIQIWDTGIGIPESELSAIFKEYHQIGNAARERSRGLGLGLSIVQRLADLLGHRVRACSRIGQGSMFAVEVMLAPQQATTPPMGDAGVTADAPPVPRTGTILVIEDDAELRQLLELLLIGEGHLVAAVGDAAAALSLVRKNHLRPDLILADYTLPGDADGLAVIATLRQSLQPKLPVIILTGDISTTALREISRQDCLQLNKPVKSEELARVIQALLPPTDFATPSSPRIDPPTIFVIDDDKLVRDGLRRVLEQDGFVMADFATSEAFLAAWQPGGEACLLLDAALPGMDGITLLQKLKESGARLPAIMITGTSDVHAAVAAMKAGAFDLIEKPLNRAELLSSITRALEQERDSDKRLAWRDDAADRLAGLTARQRQIMELVLAGSPSKNIAADLGVSQRTVENHRAAIMKKTQSRSLPALARLAFAAAWPAKDSAPRTGDE